MSVALIGRNAISVVNSATESNKSMLMYMSEAELSSRTLSVEALSLLSVWQRPLQN